MYGRYLLGSGEYAHEHASFPCDLTFPAWVAQRLTLTTSASSQGRKASLSGNIPSVDVYGGGEILLAGGLVASLERNLQSPMNREQ